MKKDIGWLSSRFCKSRRCGRMKPTLRRRFIEWVCKVCGHRSEFRHIYAGHRHYVCKRCGAIGTAPLSWQMRAILEQVERNWKRKRRK